MTSLTKNICFPRFFINDGGTPFGLDPTTYTYYQMEIDKRTATATWNSPLFSDAATSHYSFKLETHQDLAGPPSESVTFAADVIVAPSTTKYFYAGDHWQYNWKPALFETYDDKELMRNCNMTMSCLS